MLISSLFFGISLVKSCVVTKEIIIGRFDVLIN